MLTILGEMDFCKQQIKKYSEMYENLLSKYSSMSFHLDYKESFELNEPSYNKKTRKTKTKLCSPKYVSDDEPEEKTKSPTESDNDLQLEIVNFICNENNKNQRSDLKVESKARSVTSSQSKPKEALDMSIEDLQNLLKNDESAENKRLIVQNAKDGDLDFKRLDQKKYDARAGIREHEEKLEKIYAEEKRLLDMGMDKTTVRNRIREQYYPEAIPANERKNPKIYIKAIDENGKLKNKTVELLAFDEDSYLDDDDPEATEEIVSRQERREPRSNDRTENMVNLDLPSIDDTDFKEKNLDNEFEKKINHLLWDVESDNSEDIVDEKPVENVE